MHSDHYSYFCSLNISSAVGKCHWNIWEWPFRLRVATKNKQERMGSSVVLGDWWKPGRPGSEWFRRRGTEKLVWSGSPHLVCQLGSMVVTLCCLLGCVWKELQPRNVRHTSGRFSAWFEVGESTSSLYLWGRKIDVFDLDVEEDILLIWAILLLEVNVRTQKEAFALCLLSLSMRAHLSFTSMEACFLRTPAQLKTSYSFVDWALSNYKTLRLFVHS